MAAVVAALAVTAVAAGVAAYSSYKENQARAEAAESALASQQADAQAAREQSERLGREGAAGVGAAAGTAREDILGGGEQARGALEQGLAGATTALQEGRREADELFREGEAAALETLEQRSNRLGELLDVGFSDFEADPGYAFRREQGEEALARQQAAQGGRFSGRAMQEAIGFSQGLATQEFGNFVNRRLAQLGFAGQYDARDLQARSAMAGYQYGTGSALANLAYGTGQSLAGYRYNTGQGLANLYQTQGQNLASLGMGAATTQANLLQGIAGQNVALTQSLLPYYQAPVGYAGGGYGALGQFASTVGQAAASYAGYSAAGQGQGQPQYQPPPQGLQYQGTTGYPQY